MGKIRTALTTILTVLAINKAGAQAIDSTKTSANTEPVLMEKTIDNYSGNIELIQGTKPHSNAGAPNSYIRSNTFYGLGGITELLKDVTGYNWTEIYTNDGTTIFGRNTLSTQVAGPVGIDNQLIYGTGMSARTGIGAHLNISPSDNSFVKPYFTPVLIDMHGKIVPNTSITGIYAEWTLTPSLKFSGFYEVNLSAKERPESSYGEGEVEWMAGSNTSVSINPSFTNKGPGELKPDINLRLKAKYSFK